MDEENKKIEEVVNGIETTPAETPAGDVVAPEGTSADAPHQKRNVFRTSAPRGKNMRRGGSRRPERVKPEFDQKILSMRRVTRVVAGGRRFSFSVALVAGNKKGLVGVGTGKAMDTALAIEKAFRDAKKNMRTVPFTKNMSVPHDTQAKYASSIVKIMPAPGRGMIAGGAVRSVLEFAGAKDVAGKILSRSKNALNNARATLKALDLMHVRTK